MLLTYLLTSLLRATAVPAGTAERVLATAILSVCLSVRLSAWGVTARYRIKPR